MIGCIRKGSQGVYVDVHVTPGSKKEAMSYDEFGNRLKVPVSSPAVDGKANKELLSIFNGLLGGCELVSGQKSRKKTLLFTNSDAEEISRILEEKVKK